MKTDAEHLPLNDEGAKRAWKIARWAIPLAIAIGLLLPATPLWPSGDAPAPLSTDERVLLLVHNEAPSWNSYSDSDILAFAHSVCGGDQLEDEARAKAVSEHDRGYLVGIALSAICAEG